MNRFALALTVTFSAALAAGCAKSTPAPAAQAPNAQANDAEVLTEAAVDAATEAPARALGLKLGFAYTANLMGELEPCG